MDILYTGHEGMESSTQSRSLLVDCLTCQESASCFGGQLWKRDPGATGKRRRGSHLGTPLSAYCIDQGPYVHG